MNIKGIKFEKQPAWPLVLGLDWGAKSLKYLLLRRVAGKIRIEEFGKVSFGRSEEPSAESVQLAFRNLYHSSGTFKKAKSVIGLGSSHVVIKRESYPSLSRKELRQTVFFELQREMGFKEGEGEAVAFDIRVVGPDPKTAGNTEYLTIGVPQSIVEQRLVPAVTEGMVPAKILPDLAVYANFLQFLPPAKPSEAIGFLDIGMQRSMLVFYRNGQVDFFREIVVGGDDFTKAITGTIFHEGRAIQFSNEEAHEFKVRYGYPLGFSEGMTFRGAPMTEVGTMMRPVMERLTGEIHRSIGFYKDKTGGQKVTGLYLLGGGSRLKHLPHVLSEKIEIPVSYVPVPKNVRIEGGKEQEKAFQSRFLEQSVSFALALESTSEFNLLPEPYQKVQKINEIRNYVNLGVAILILFAGLFHWLAFSKSRSLRGETALMEKRAVISRGNIRRFDGYSRQKTTADSSILMIDRKMLQDGKPVQVMRCISNTLPKSLSLKSYYIGKDQKVLSEPLKQKLNPKPSGNTTAPNPAPKTGQPSPGDQKKQEPVFLYVRGGSKASIPDIRIAVAEFLMALEESGYLDNIQLAQETVIKETDEYAFDILAILK